MNKEKILVEIKRMVAENGGVPVGRVRFEKETGISYSSWRGKFWRNWSEAVAEAGFAPYMLKLGKHYKIGKTFSVPRRHREIAIELPEKPDIVHVIATDDPTGIESYWHNRFASKRTNGEWFSLSLADIRAFKRRKFM